MHDFHIADKILRLVLEEAEKSNLQKISKIVIELGDIREHGDRITPKNLKFNLKMLAQGTLAEKAEIIIRSTKGDSFGLKEIYGQ